MEKLNQLESSLVDSIVIENQEKYPFLNSHIHYLYVISREHTGVGLYSSFGYTEDLNSKKQVNDVISSEKILTVEGLRYELSYVLDISNGRISFLEIVTNGNELWDGKCNGFSLQ